MSLTYHTPAQHPSKHRNAKRTKGRKRAARVRAEQLSHRKHDAMKYEGRYRD